MNRNLLRFGTVLVAAASFLASFARAGFISPAPLNILLTVDPAQGRGVVTPPPPARLNLVASDPVRFQLGRAARAEWRHNNTVLGTTTDGQWKIDFMPATGAGAYHAVLLDEISTVTGQPTVTDAVVVSVIPSNPFVALATRVQLAGAGEVAIAGFVIAAEPNHIVSPGKLVLIRAVGPSLGHYGVLDPLPKPVLRIYGSDGKEYVEPPRIATTPALEEIVERVGAFVTVPGAADAWAVHWMPAGAYTAQVRSGDGQPGTTLIEVYAVPMP